MNNLHYIYSQMIQGHTLTIITLICANMLWEAYTACSGGTPLAYAGNCYAACPTEAPYDYQNTCFPNCPWDPDTELTYLEGSSCVTECTSGYADDYTRECVTDCSTEPIQLFKDTTRKICVQMCSTNPSEFGYQTNHTCMQYCPSGTWGDPDTRLCVQTCPTGTYYQLSGSHRVCTSRCYAGTYADLDDVCVDASNCPDSPVEYYGDDTTNLCVEQCPETYYGESSSSKCVFFCSLGTFGDTTTQTCVEDCPVGPPRYYGSNTTRVCHLECIEGQFADNSLGECVQVCTNNTFGDYHTRTCVATCPEEHDTYADPLTYLCVELCATNYYADDATRSCVSSTDCSDEYVGNPLNRQCVMPADCPINYYINIGDKLCVKKCEDPLWANMDTRYCMNFCEWNPPFYVSWMDPSTRRCVEQCPESPRLFRSNSTQECVETCPEGEFGSVLTYQCVTTCPDGFHSQMQNNICVSDCTSTDDLILYFYQPNTTCIEACPEGYYADNTTISCVTVCPELTYAYQSNNTCLWQCPDGWFSDDHSQQCVTSCPAITDFYADDSTNMCVEVCPVTPDYYGEDLNDGHRKCVSQCTLTSKYADPLTRTCVSECNVSEGYFAYQDDRRCYLTCPTGWGNPLTTKCVQTCPQSPFQLFGDNLTSTCVERCPKNTYGDRTTEICMEAEDCPAGTFGDDQTATCVSKCSRLLNLFGDPVSKKCVKSCPHPLYADNTTRTCVATCNVTAKTYKDPSTKTCVHLCPELPDLYADPSTMTCVAVCPDDGYALAYNTTVTQTRKCVEMCPSSPAYLADEQNHKCVLTCANGTYKFINNTYRGCLDYCPQQVFNSSVSMDLYTDNTTWTCVSVCPFGYYAFKHPTNSTIRKCVPMCEIVDDVYYFAEENTRKCVTDCPLFQYGTYGDRINFQCNYTCSRDQYRDDETAECTYLCTQGTFADNSTWNCVEECPDGTFAESINRTCVKYCPTDYFGYERTNTCEERCDDHWRYYADNTSWLCVQECPEDPDYYADIDTKQCVLTCSQPRFADPMTRRCTSSHNCQNDTVADPINRRCVKRCTTDPMYFAMNNTLLCGPQCFDGLFADNTTGFCVDICPESYYGVNSTTYFYCTQYCPEDQFKYQEDRICLADCPDGYFADSLTMSCVTQCPDDYYGNRDDNTCITDCTPLYRDDATKQCEEVCTDGTASNGTYMCEDQCEYGEYEYEGVCYANCQNLQGLYADNLTRKCLDECPEDPFTFADPVSHRCVFVCPNDYYGYTENRTCMEYCPDELYKQADLNLCMDPCPQQQYADPSDMTCVDDCLSDDYTYINPINASCMAICPEDPDLYGLNEEQCVPQCPENLFAENFTRVCIDKCPNVSDVYLNQSWADPLTRRCVARCSALSYAITNETINYCVNECPDGWFASELEQACVQQCPNDTYAHNDSKRCVELCPAGEYGDNISKICVSDCSHNEEFKDDSTHMCVSQCPDVPSMFAQASTNSCVLACQDVGYFSYIVNRTCLQDCPEPYFEDQDTGQCVLECSIHTETFADEILRQCVTQCDNHTVNGSEVIFYADSSTSVCVDMCPEYPQKLYGFNQTNQCLETCPEGTLGDNDTRLCLDECIFEDPKYTWADFEDNFCVELCPFGFFADNRTVSCVDNCTEGFYADNSTRRCVVTCPVDPVSYGLLPDRICVYFCPEGLFADESTRNCIEQCPTSPQLYYHYTPTNKCVQQCLYPYFAEDSSQNCVETCQDGFYGNLTTHKCELCKTECVTCTARLQCTSCAEGFFLLQAQLTCVTSCPSYPVMYFAHLQSGICFLECPEPYFGQTNTGLCQLSCPVLYYGSLTNRTCTKCPTGCFTCDIDGCYTCEEGYTHVEPSLSCSQKCNNTHQYQFQDVCYEICPDGTFLDVSDLVTCLKCNEECATCENEAANCTRCAYKFFYQGQCVNTCPDDFFVNENMTCKPCSEYPDRCILDPLTYTIQPFTENYKLHAYVIFNRVVDISLSEFSSIVQIYYNNKVVKANQFTVQFYNKTTYWITFRSSKSLNENSLSIGFQPGAITDMYGNHLTVNQVSEQFEAETGVTEEIAQRSEKVGKSANIFSWILLAIVLLFLIKSGYPFLIAIETAQLYYMFIFIRLDPAPYMLVKFLQALKYLHLLFFPVIFPKLDNYVIDQYDTFLINTSFLYNCSPFIFVFAIVILLFIIFSILKSKKVISNKRVRNVSKRIRKHRLKYMVFHDAFWVTFVYATFMALLQFGQASMQTLWDTINIAFAVLVAVLFLVFTIAMIYLGNKYKDPKTKLPNKYSFLRMEPSKFPMQIPLRFVRKFLFCAALVIPYADTQSILIILLSVVFLFFFICYMPSQSKITNGMNIAIQTSYIILAGMCYGYNKLTEKDLQSQEGFAYGMIVIICLMMLAILIWIVYRGILVIRGTESWAYVYMKLTENKDPEYLKEQQRKRDLQFDFGSLENRSNYDDKTDHYRENTSHRMKNTSAGLDEKFNIFEMEDKDASDDDSHFVSRKLKFNNAFKGNSPLKMRKQSEEDDDLIKDSSSHDGSAIKGNGSNFQPNRTQELGKRKGHLQIRQKDQSHELDQIDILGEERQKKKPTQPQKVQQHDDQSSDSNDQPKRAIWDDIEFDEHEI